MHACLKSGTVVPITVAGLLIQIDVAHFMIDRWPVGITGVVEARIDSDNVLSVAERCRIGYAESVFILRNVCNNDFRIFREFVVEVCLIRIRVPSIYEFLLFCIITQTASSPLAFA